MFDITSLIPGRKKQTQSGWISFNAICCGHRGHKPDRRSRGGLKLEGNNWVMHCFNCSYSCNFTLGKQIGPKTKQFLKWCGCDETQIQRWSLESLQHKDALDLIQPQHKKALKFQNKELPENSERLDKNNQNHQLFINYLDNRSIDLSKYTFYVTPYDKDNIRNQQRIIVPYNYKNKLVGFTSRYIDGRIPKYINEQQPGYVFNIDQQKYDWQYCIVTEGIFDALAIDGVAVMHDDINIDQAQLIAQLNKRIIVVPDFDKTGLKLIDRALELGYHVSLPNWGPNVKDVNDAVVKYGKLPTLLAILQSATMSKIKLEMQRKKIGKQNGF